MQQHLGPRNRAFAGAVVALLIVTSVPTLVASVALGTAPLPAGPPEQWAYAGAHWQNVTLNGSRGAYIASGYFGWTVVYTLTNTSNTTFMIEAQRTLGLRYSAAFCAPSCANASASMNLSVSGQEQETGFANFTVLGTVLVNGTNTSALGLQNAQSSATSSLNESMSAARSLSGIVRGGSTSIRVAGAAHSSVTFTPALGLVPWSLGPGLEWTSRASFAATGGFDLRYAWDLAGPNSSLNGSGSPSGQLNQSGTVQLIGHDLGNLTLENGVATEVVALTWASGPFDAEDGIILVPHGFEIFAAGPHPWSSEAPGVQSVFSSRLDLVTDLVHHRLRFAAAASSYAGSDSLASGVSGSAHGGLNPASSSPGGYALVQAQPVSVPTAESQSSCLMGRCPGSPSAGLVPSTEVVVAVFVVIAVLGTIGGLEYRIWSRLRTSGPSQAAPAPPTPPEPSAALPPEAPAGPMEPPRVQ